jgi:hypothetical protein
MECCSPRAPSTPLRRAAQPDTAQPKALASHCTSWCWFDEDSLGEPAAHAFDEPGVRLTDSLCNREPECPARDCPYELPGPQAVVATTSANFSDGVIR